MTRLEAAIVLAIVAILIALLVPAVQSSRSSHPWERLDRVSRALEEYHLQHGTLPPAYVCDKSGRPAHSWRVLILPQLGYDALYRRYRFDEPWDGPNNTTLLDEMPSVFRMSGARNDQRRLTAWQVVVGPDTAWPGATPRSLDAIPDDPMFTLLVVECEARPVPWTAPQDLSESEAVDYLMEPPRYPRGFWDERFFTSRNSGRLVSLFPQRPCIVRGLPASAEVLQSLVRVNDGVPIGDDPYAFWPNSPQTVIHYGHVARLVFFLIVVLWPFGRLLAEARRARAEALGKKLPDPNPQ